MYALNARSGEFIWKVRPVDHYSTMATATPRFFQGWFINRSRRLRKPLEARPKFECCTFRGSVVAIDAGTGKKIWQTFTIPEPSKPTRKSPAGAQQHGPSGASIWSSPTIDEQLGVLYVATGDKNYSDPPTNMSDAILAMDLKTGELRWSRQLTENDAFNNGCSTPQRTNCPEKSGPDHDFGQPPILVRLGEGKRALVIAQKSGMVHAVDPDEKGKILWQTRAGEGGPLGGSQWGSASDGQKIYVAISDVGPRRRRGSKIAARVSADAGSQEGRRTARVGYQNGQGGMERQSRLPAQDGRTDCSPAQSAAVSAIPGVVFSGSVDGHLRAYSTATGKFSGTLGTAHEFQTVNGQAAQGGSHGGTMDAAGPAVVNGMVFVNSGYGQWAGCPETFFWPFPWMESNHEIDRGRMSMLSFTKSPNSSRRKL